VFSGSGSRILNKKRGAVPTKSTFLLLCSVSRIRIQTFFDSGSRILNKKRGTVPVPILMIFSKIEVQFRIRIRTHKFELRIRILQKVLDPSGCGSTTLSTGTPLICGYPYLCKDPGPAECDLARAPVQAKCYVHISSIHQPSSIQPLPLPQSLTTDVSHFLSFLL
jgi:hypothetical protein